MLAHDTHLDNSFVHDENCLTATSSRSLHITEMFESHLVVTNPIHFKNFVCDDLFHHHGVLQRLGNIVPRSELRRHFAKRHLIAELELDGPCLAVFDVGGWLAQSAATR